VIRRLGNGFRQGKGSQRKGPLIYVHEVFATRFVGPKAGVRQYQQGTGGDRYLLANRLSQATGHPPGPRRPEPREYPVLPLGAHR
jgi:hypothetical protein